MKILQLRASLYIRFSLNLQITCPLVCHVPNVGIRECEIWNVYTIMFVRHRQAQQGRLGNPVGWASDSWFRLEAWSRGRHGFGVMGSSPALGYVLSRESA